MTLAGLPGLRGGEDGKSIAARFDEPHGICYDDTTKSVIVCEPRSNRLRRVQLNGMTSNLPLPHQDSITSIGMLMNIRGCVHYVSNPKTCGSRDDSKAEHPRFLLDESNLHGYSERYSFLHFSPHPTSHYHFSTWKL